LPGPSPNNPTPPNNQPLSTYFFNQVVSVGGRAVSNLDEFKEVLANCRTAGEVTVDVIFFSPPDVSGSGSIDEPGDKGIKVSESMGELSRKMGVDEVSMAGKVHGRLLGLTSGGSTDSTPQPFDELPHPQKMNLVLMVRVCRRIVEVSLRLPAQTSSHISSAVNQTGASPNSTTEVIGNFEPESVQGNNHRKPTLPPQIEFDTSNEASPVFKEDPLSNEGELLTLIADLLDAGDSLCSQAMQDSEDVKNDSAAELLLTEAEHV
jgi:hypothetical protein